MRMNGIGVWQDGSGEIFTSNQLAGRHAKRTWQVDNAHRKIDP